MVKYPFHPYEEMTNLNNTSPELRGVKKQMISVKQNDHTDQFYYEYNEIGYLIRKKEEYSSDTINFVYEGDTVIKVMNNKGIILNKVNFEYTDSKEIISVIYQSSTGSDSLFYVYDSLGRMTEIINFDKTRKLLCYSNNQISEVLSYENKTLIGKLKYYYLGDGSVVSNDYLVKGNLPQESTLMDSIRYVYSDDNELVEIIYLGGLIYKMGQSKRILTYNHKGLLVSIREYYFEKGGNENKSMRYLEKIRYNRDGLVLKKQVFSNKKEIIVFKHRYIYW